jgi:PHP family Zn ribbon phosphoesterase
MVVNLRCINCKYHYTFKDKKSIPNTCPWCNQQWNKRVRESDTLLNVIYNAVTHKKTKGFVYCDNLGWTSDTSFGEEVRTYGVRSNSDEDPYTWI